MSKAYLHRVFGKFVSLSLHDHEEIFDDWLHRGRLFRCVRRGNFELCFVTTAASPSQSIYTELLSSAATQRNIARRLHRGKKIGRISFFFRVLQHTGYKFDQRNISWRTVMVDALLPWEWSPTFSRSPATSSSCLPLEVHCGWSAGAASPAPSPEPAPNVCLLPTPLPAHLPTTKQGCQAMECDTPCGRVRALVVFFSSSTWTFPPPCCMHVGTHVGDKSILFSWNLHGHFHLSKLNTQGQTGY